MKVFREWSPRQEWLLPPSPHDWLAQGHLVYCVLDLIEQLDLSGIEGATSTGTRVERRGTTPG